MHFRGTAAFSNYHLEKVLTADIFGSSKHESVFSTEKCYLAESGYQLKCHAMYTDLTGALLIFA